jgi:cyclophilin family peptidyl-prolyl cis-trans isomerase
MMTRLLPRLLSHVLGAAALLPLAACANSFLDIKPEPASSSAAKPIDDTKPTVLISMKTSKGEIILELDRAHAPISVANFLAYADAGKYDGTIFHRIVENFVIQGGGWTQDSPIIATTPNAASVKLTERAKLDAAAGRPDVPIKNEWTNGLKNEKGTIAMARESAPDSATREWYINVQNNPKLDTARALTGNAGYAVFGKVVRGMEVVEAIRHIPTKRVNVPGVDDGSMENVPVERVVIERVARVR